MGYLQEDAGTVAGARVTAGRSAVRQVLQDFQRLFDDVVGGGAFERRYEAKAASVMFEPRIVQPLSRRKPHAGILPCELRRAAAKARSHVEFTRWKHRCTCVRKPTVYGRCRSGLARRAGMLGGVI
jgi:hypothetical protein